MNEKLARDGGTPVRSAPFPTWPVWDGADEKALLEALRSGEWGRNAGTHVVAFEEEFAAFQGTKYCIAVVNGTCALELGLRVLDVEYGDEVIVPSYTFVATPAAPLFLGAIPVFADIDPDTFELDPASVEAAITPRTKAIIPVHIAGQPPDMDGILDGCVQGITCACWRMRRRPTALPGAIKGWAASATSAASASSPARILTPVKAARSVRTTRSWPS